MNTEFENDLLPQVLGADASVEPLRMRCPNCKKLYSVSASMLGAGDLTRFECVNCSEAFFAMRPELNGASFLETHELETQFAPLSTSLPLMDFEEAPVSLELERVVRSALVDVPLAPERDIDRSRESVVAADVELSGSGELVMMWQAITADYQNMSLHEAFVLECQRLVRLQFAAHKYAQMLTLAPDEPIARMMRARVEGLALHAFDAADAGMGWQAWTFPLPSFNSMIILMGTILVCIGFGFPNMRQTAGLGFAMIALAIGMRVFMRRPRA